MLTELVNSDARLRTQVGANLRLFSRALSVFSQINLSSPAVVCRLGSNRPGAQSCLKMNYRFLPEPPATTAITAAIRQLLPRSQSQFLAALVADPFLLISWMRRAARQSFNWRPSRARLGSADDRSGKDPRRIRRAWRNRWPCFIRSTGGAIMTMILARDVGSEVAVPPGLAYDLPKSSRRKMTKWERAHVATSTLRSADWRGRR